MPGLTPANVADVLDSAGLPIRRAHCARRCTRSTARCAATSTEDAVLVGVESRTSSPVRIPRDPETLESPDIAGLYPAARARATPAAS